MELEQLYEGKHVQNIKKAQGYIYRKYKATSRKLAQLFADYEIKNPEGFTFAQDKILDKRLTVELGRMNTTFKNTITQAMVANWNLANQKNDKLAIQYLRNINAVQGTKDYFNANIAAMNSFINRTEGGMSLSKRVWNITNQFRVELETYVGSGIAVGRSASDIAQDIQHLLKDPDHLFRRIRNEKGNLVLSNAARTLSVRPGVYRSSYKNALRLTATETNMAYRMADFERRQQLDFVMGIRVHLSGSHPRPDICDDMAGDYPKDFVYRGWHPWCLCYTTSILMSGSEYKRMMQTGVNPKRIVKEIPENANRYILEKAEAFKRMKVKPYFVKDNSAFFKQLVEKAAQS